MKTFKSHLKEKLQNSQFEQSFDEEKELVRMGLEIAEARTKIGISQSELARRASVTQQQVSKIENGVNCNVLTFDERQKGGPVFFQMNQAGFKHWQTLLPAIW